MNFKEQILDILFDLKNSNIDRRKIEDDLGYSNGYIDQIISRGGNKKFLDTIKRYRDLNVVKSKVISATPEEHIAALSAMVQGMRHILVEHESKVNGISFAEAALRVDKVLKSAAEQQLSGA